MKEIVLKQPEQIKLKIGETEYLINQPTLEDQHILQSEIEEATASKKSTLEPMLNWADRIGLGRAAVMKLPVSTFTELVQALSGADDKKKP